MVELTVIVRVWNSAEVLPQLLARLKVLFVPVGCSGELIFVDNLSTDTTREQIQAVLPRLPLPAHLVIEPQRGSGLARVRGLVEARGNYVAFLDDDNLPQVDWLAQIWQQLKTFSEPVVLSGRNLPVTKEPIPAYVLPYLAFFALVDRGDQQVCYSSSRWGVVPPGAGLVVPRSQTLRILQQTPLRLRGPVGSRLVFKGEDVELLRRLQQAGIQIWYCPEIVIEHHLSSRRFMPEYMISFLKAIARPRHYHRLLQYQPGWWLPITLGYIASDGLKLLAHLRRYEDSLDWHLRRVFLIYLFISPVFTPRIWMTLQSRCPWSLSRPAQTLSRAPQAGLADRVRELTASWQSSLMSPYSVQGQKL
jgi:glycosyltransferase involved in cell wall biosynthesis